MWRVWGGEADWAPLPLADGLFSAEVMWWRGDRDAFLESSGDRAGDATVSHQVDCESAAELQVALAQRGWNINDETLYTCELRWNYRSESLRKLWPKTIKKNTNSTPNKSQTQRARAYKVTSFLSTDCELSTNSCSKFLYSLGPMCNLQWCF